MAFTTMTACSMSEQVQDLCNTKITAEQTGL